MRKILSIINIIKDNRKLSDTEIYNMAEKDEGTFSGTDEVTAVIRTIGYLKQLDDKSLDIIKNQVEQRKTNGGESN